jgi:hypothetical protein
MSRHVAGDTDGRNSVGRRSFDCLQSPPRPSLAHRRRTRLAAAHGELYGFPSRAGVFAAFSMPGENRFRIFGAVPPRPEGPSAKYSEPTDEEFQAMLDERLPLPAKVLKEYWVTAACLAPLGHARLPGGVFRSRPERRTSGAVEGHREYFSRSLNAPRYACDVARIKSACVDTNFSTQSELRSLAVPSSSLNTPSNIFSYASSQMRGHSLCSTRARARSSI